MSSVATNRETIGIVLFNMGGPDSMESIQPFLFNLFRDEDIIQLPLGWLYQTALARWISVKRSPKVAIGYRYMGGKSPLKETTEAQAAALEALLNKESGPDGPRYRCLVAMRYWHPFTEAAIQTLQAEGIRRVVLLSLYPHYSRATTGSNLHEWQRIVDQQGLRFETTVLCSYPRHEEYCRFLADLIEETLAQFPPDVPREKLTVLFSAHGLPQKYVDDGDPYRLHIETTVEAVMRHLPGQPFRLGFQSIVGPVKWLQPNSLDVIAELGAGGSKGIAVVPISFVSEHIETLYEVGVEFAEEAHKRGIPHFKRVPAPCVDERFIRVLAGMTTRHLGGCPAGMECHASEDTCCAKLTNKSCLHDVNEWLTREQAPRAMALK